MNFSYQKRDGSVLEWKGVRACLCTECEVLFAGVTAFDKHLRREARGGHAEHLPPQQVGLELNDWGQWHDASKAQEVRERFEFLEAA